MSRLLTPDERLVVLDQLAQGASKYKACRAAGCKRRDLDYTLGRVDEFREEYDRAYQDGVDGLEDEARRRAVDGVQTPVYDRDGELVGYKHKYSDRLLEVLLAANRPEKYRPARPGDVAAEPPDAGAASAIDRLAQAVANVARAAQPESQG